MPTQPIDTTIYHHELYSNHELFESGTWLATPDANVLSIGNDLLGLAEMRILDLGAGVGRNAIPLAKLLKDRGVLIDCVDVLNTAIVKLAQYAVKYGVVDSINPVLADVSTYLVLPEQFDFILAESVLEHCTDMRAIIKRVQQGTKKGGLIVLVLQPI
jgi:tellurite methyltransferase